MGKLLYNLELWGHLNLTLSNKINKLMVKSANIVTKYSHIGRTDDKILQEAGWLNFKSTLRATCHKLTYKLINSLEGNQLTNEMILNRNIRYKSENITGLISPTQGWDSRSQLTFMYSSKNLYNRIPRHITLSPNSSIFKVWLNRWMRDEKHIIPKRNDYIGQDNVYLVTKSADCELFTTLSQILYLTKSFTL